ncbi:MAG: hypothetical protein AAB263_14765 [Planctomycetota bacterium]
MRAAFSLAPLVLFSTITAAEPSGETPLLVQVGGSYLSAATRVQLEKTWGAYVGVATLLTDTQGFVGWPSADLDARYANGPTTSLLSVTACYTERFISSGERYYFGLGIGGSYNEIGRLASGSNPSRKDKSWGFGGKALFGYLLTNRAFVEASYFQTPELAGIETKSMTVGLGYWF